jgi:hypothetical protein
MTDTSHAVLGHTPRRGLSADKLAVYVMLVLALGFWGLYSVELFESYFAMMG